MSLVAMGTAKRLKTKRVVPVNGQTGTHGIQPASSASQFVARTVGFTPTGTNTLTPSYVTTPTTQPYMLFVPANYDPTLTAGYGLILAVPGAGGRGNDNTSQLVDGLWPTYLSSRTATFPYFVAFLQLPLIAGPNTGTRNACFGMLGPAIDAVSAEWNINLSRVGIHGWSQGAALPAEAMIQPALASRIRFMAGASSGPFWQGINLLTPVSPQTDAQGDAMLVAANPSMRWIMRVADTDANAPWPRALNTAYGSSNPNWNYAEYTGFDAAHAHQGGYQQFCADAAVWTIINGWMA